MCSSAAAAGRRSTIHRASGTVSVAGERAFPEGRRQPLRAPSGARSAAAAASCTAVGTYCWSPITEQIIELNKNMHNARSFSPAEG